jgi:hypothetical protein
MQIDAEFDAAGLSQRNLRMLFFLDCLDVRQWRLYEFAD